MKVKRERFANSWILLAAGSLLLNLPGCTSRSSKTSEKAETKQPAKAGSANQASDHFDGGSYCVQTMAQGPPVAGGLHFSVKVNESDDSLKSKDYEADLSGDSLDIANHERWRATDDDIKMNQENARLGVYVIPIHEGFAEPVHINHYTRSDASGWNAAASMMIQGGTPWGLFIYKPVVTKVGAEIINGFDTIKYAVDTTHQTPMEKSAGFLRQLKDYNITGGAWVLKDASCILQYAIDDERISNDGKVSKTHYEGTVTKK